MLKMSNLSNRKRKYLLISSTFILVLSSVLFSSCGLFATSGTIIFTSNRVQIAGSQQNPSLQPLDTEIYSMGQNGNNIIKLTDTIGVYQDASFSPDGKKIVFAYNSMDAPNEGIYIMDANGKDIIRLSGDADQDSDPAW